MRSLVSLPGLIALTAMASGTVRWGLRAGDHAWPDRSAPAPAVGELSVDRMSLSLSGIGRLHVVLMPRLRRFGRSDRIFRWLRFGAGMFDLGGDPGLSGFGNPIGCAGLTSNRGSGTHSHYRGQGAPPRASRVEPGQRRARCRPGLDRNRLLTRPARSRSSFAPGHAPGQLGRALRVWAALIPASLGSITTIPRSFGMTAPFSIR